MNRELVGKDPEQIPNSAVASQAATSSAPLHSPRKSPPTSKQDQASESPRFPWHESASGPLPVHPADHPALRGHILQRFAQTVQHPVACTSMTNPPGLNLYWGN